MQRGSRIHCAQSRNVERVESSGVVRLISSRISRWSESGSVGLVLLGRHHRQASLGLLGRHHYSDSARERDVRENQKSERYSAWHNRPRAAPAGRVAGGDVAGTAGAYGLRSRRSLARWPSLWDCSCQAAQPSPCAALVSSCLYPVYVPAAALPCMGRRIHPMRRSARSRKC
eukprot:scaffold71834_cov54-Phaeocystis_antarctica.AAC.3